MIEIEKSLSADSRTADGNVTKEILLASTEQHIDDVRKAVYFFIDKLKEIADKHDWSKIEYIHEFHQDFSRSQNDKEFKLIDGTWYPKHIQLERHHLNNRCPDDVNLLDIIERVSDIVMAGMARSGEVFDDNLDDEILQKALKNTIDMLKKEINVNDSIDDTILF